MSYSPPIGHFNFAQIGLYYFALTLDIFSLMELANGIIIIKQRLKPYTAWGRTNHLQEPRAGFK